MLRIRLSVHLEGLVSFGKEGLLELPRFKLAEFDVCPRTDIQEPIGIQWVHTKADYVARAELDLGEPSVVNPPLVYERVDALISGFRLFRPGYVGANPILIEVSTGDEKWSIPHFEGRSARSQEGGLAYPLTPSQIPDLANFGNEVIPLLSSKPVLSLTNPAFQFFNRGIDDEARNDHALAIVDFVSCMEAVLSRGTSELSHRLSEVVAVVTERSPERRRERYNQCKELYHMRSKTIHSVGVDDAAEFVNLAESLARYIMRFNLGYYSHGGGKADLVSDAESVLFGQVKDFPEYAFKHVKDLPIPQSAM